MPLTSNNHVRLYWEEHGQGSPLLLIMGLSFTLEMWHRALPELSKSYRCILFDNRGVGRSDAPRGRRYSIQTMAEDAAAVLDAAGVEEPAFVLGASMGGMIAQELALRYPYRVRALVLACTASGFLWRRAWPRLEWVPAIYYWVASKGEAHERALRRLLYAETTPTARIEEDIVIRMRCRPLRRPVLCQLAGILSWNSHRRLSQINVPTLAIHGDEDHILPPINGRIVAKQIPNAEFVLIPHAGHMLITDQPELSFRVVKQFLDRVAASPNACDFNAPV
ncbi:MAG TPA: alpha/beta hydrolase [Bryobacteraceae bacterium]|nr:alpha/beta hydrolase [Bryobacteraceae bacterium]